MKNNKWIFLVVIAILVILVLFIVKNTNKKGIENNEIVVQETKVQTMQDGTKLNTSSKLDEVKKVGNLEITNAQLTSKDNKTTFLANVKNIGNQKLTMIDVEVILLDEQGKTVKVFNGLLGTIAPNATIQLNIETLGSYENIYDYKINLK